MTCIVHNIPQIPKFLAVDEYHLAWALVLLSSSMKTGNPMTSREWGFVACEKKKESMRVQSSCCMKPRDVIIHQPVQNIPTMRYLVVSVVDVIESLVPLSLSTITANINECADGTTRM